MTTPLNREAQASVALDGETQCVAAYEELVQVLKEIETVAVVAMKVFKNSRSLQRAALQQIAAKAHNAVRGL